MEADDVDKVDLPQKCVLCNRRSPEGSRYATILAQCVQSWEYGARFRYLETWKSFVCTACYKKNAFRILPRQWNNNIFETQVAYRLKYPHHSILMDDPQTLKGYYIKKDAYTFTPLEWKTLKPEYISQINGPKPHLSHDPETEVEQ